MVSLMKAQSKADGEINGAIIDKHNGKMDTIKPTRAKPVHKDPLNDHEMNGTIHTLKVAIKKTHWRPGGIEGT